MKLSNLIEDTSQNLVAQKYQLLHALRGVVEEIPPNIGVDTYDGEIKYEEGNVLDGLSGMFSDHGKCIVGFAEDILYHLESEKVLLLAGGYDGDYENFFEPTNMDNELLVKKNLKVPDSVLIKFKGRNFILSVAEFLETINDFVGQKAKGPHWFIEYERPNGIDEHEPDEEESRYWPRYHRSHDNEPSEDDYKFITCKMSGGLLYKNLHHE